MLKTLLPTMVLALGLSGHAFAAEEKPGATEGQSSLKIEDTTNQKNKVPGDLDEEITNAKLRAESGSKSKWSLSFTTNYSGASLEKPFGRERPNTNQEPTPPQVRMDGTFGARMRMNKNESLSLGTGYSMRRPFHQATGGEVTNPYVEYGHAGKIGQTQSIFAATLTGTTARDELTLGSQGSVTLSEVLMYDFGGSRFSVGVAADGQYTQFQDNKNELARYEGTEKIFTVGTRQVDGIIGIYPLMEYAFNDRINLRTVFRPLIFDHIVMKTAEGNSGWEKRRWTQSIGVGIAATRDIFLYPNFQYDWYQWQGDDFNFFRETTRSNSTVGLSATINIF